MSLLHHEFTEPDQKQQNFFDYILSFCSEVLHAWRCLRLMMQTPVCTFRQSRLVLCSAESSILCWTGSQCSWSWKTVVIWSNLVSVVHAVVLSAFCSNHSHTIEYAVAVVYLTSNIGLYHGLICTFHTWLMHCICVSKW